MTSSYQKLENHFDKLGRLSSIRSLMFWDGRVNLPENSVDVRSEQLSFLSRMRHEYLTDDKVGRWLADAGDGLSEWEAANVREMERRHRQATAVSEKLVEAVTEAASRCEMQWRRAKHEDDFGIVESQLEELVELKRKVAGQKAEALGLEPYQAMVYEYDPGLDVELIDSIFARLADRLPDLIDRIIEDQPSTRPRLSESVYPEARQKQLVKSVMSDFGFDFTRGRLDKSEHAFSGGTQGDIRITTTYDDKNPLVSIVTAVHETGHALYENGLPDEWKFQPVGASRGMTTHESQSLFLEKRIAHSSPFCEYLAPKIREHFPDTELANWSAQKIYAHLNGVERSFIRIHADEVTYPIHVILRYELERSLIQGGLEVSDLPDAWNAKMSEYLQIEPSRPSQGVLQDVHWMQGAFGYFPTYTLGALMAAQLYEAMQQDVDDLNARIADGRFGSLVEWLRENVHQKSSFYSTQKLCEEATGQTLAADSFMNILGKKYLDE